MLRVLFLMDIKSYINSSYFDALGVLLCDDNTKENVCIEYVKLNTNYDEFIDGSNEILSIYNFLFEK